MLPRLALGSYKVRLRLADSPEACISFPSRPKELDHFGSERWGIQEEPALIENSNAWLPCLSARARCHSIRDQHAHGGFKLSGRFSALLHLEEATSVHALCWVAVVTACGKSVFSRPCR